MRHIGYQGSLVATQLAVNCSGNFSECYRFDFSVLFSSLMNLSLNST